MKLKVPFEEDSLDELKRRIETYIIRTRKKILIVVDDIDRLQPNEMLLVFKLVRLSARFKNTFFLLSYDELTVKRYLEDILKVDAEYLEKIIQKPISLPIVEQSKLDGFLWDRLDKFLEEIKIPQQEADEFRKAFEQIYRQQVKRLFSNLRDAKRYLNGLLPAIPQLKGEVDLFDYCVFEVVRVRFYKVYKDIWFNRGLYLKPDDEIYLSLSISPLIEKEERNKSWMSSLKKVITSLI